MGLKKATYYILFIDLTNLNELSLLKSSKECKVFLTLKFKININILYLGKIEKNLQLKFFWFTSKKDDSKTNESSLNYLFFIIYPIENHPCQSDQKSVPRENHPWD